MGRKIFRSGSSIVVSLPPDVLEALNLDAGDEVNIIADPEQQRIVITPLQATLPGVRSDFLEKVDRFIDRYQPALEKLAQG